MRKALREKPGKTKTKRAPLRIPYGQEQGKWFPKTDDGLCHDCGVELGALHPLTCAVNQCGVCGGQTIVCCGCGAYGTDQEFWEAAQVDLKAYAVEYHRKKRALAEQVQIVSEEDRRN